MLLIRNYASSVKYIVDKRAKILFTKSSQIKSKNITLDINTEISELEPNKTHKYSRINEANDINHSITQEKKKEKNSMGE